MDLTSVVYRLREIVHDSKDTAELREAILELADDIEGKNISAEQWNDAIENARFMLEEYKKIPTGAFGAVTIAELIGRYDSGERTSQLFNELEDIH